VSERVSIDSVTPAREATQVPSSGGRVRNLRSLFGSEAVGPRLAAFAAALSPLWGLTQVFLDLSRGDPHDADGIADHVGGAFLTSGASGHHRPSKIICCLLKK
jgi:hypothetical protein